MATTSKPVLSRQRSFVVAFAVLLAALVLPSVAAARLPVIATAPDRSLCVDRTAIGPANGYEAIKRPGDPFEVIAPPALHAQADVIDRGLGPSYHDVWGKERAIVGGLPLGPLPYNLIIVPGAEIPPGIDAYTLPYCGDTRATAIAIPDNFNPRDLLANLVHEAFHAFQTRAIGHVVPGGWFSEATAAWAEGLFVQVSMNSKTAQRDRAFLQLPQLPVDLFRYEPRALKMEHQYGAFRFIEFLRGRLGTASFYAVLRETLRRIGAGERDIVALEGAVLANGRRLDEELGRFWASRLRPGAGDGPRTEGTALVVGIGSQDLHEGRDPLAAAVVRIAPKPEVRRLTVTFGPAPAGSSTWLDDGGAGPVNVTAGATRTYCLDGAASGAERPWPGDVSFAYVNGKHVGIRVLDATVVGSADPCRPDPPTPGSGRCGQATPGVYDTFFGAPSFTPPGIYFDVSLGCSLNAFGGRLTSPTCARDLGPEGTGQPIRRPIVGDDIRFQYRYGDGLITVALHFHNRTASGTIDYAAPGCHLEYGGFAALLVRPYGTSAHARVATARASRPHSMLMSASARRTRLRTRCWSLYLVDSCHARLVVTAQLGTRRPHTAVLARGRFVAHAGHSRAVALGLPASLRRRLAGGQGVPVAARIRARSSHGDARTLRARVELRR